MLLGHRSPGRALPSRARCQVWWTSGRTRAQACALPSVPPPSPSTVRVRRCPPPFGDSVMLVLYCGQACSGRQDFGPATANGACGADALAYLGQMSGALSPLNSGPICSTSSWTWRPIPSGLRASMFDVLMVLGGVCPPPPKHANLATSTGATSSQAEHRIASDSEVSAPRPQQQHPLEVPRRSHSPTAGPLVHQPRWRPTAGVHRERG